MCVCVCVYTVGPWYLQRTGSRTCAPQRIPKSMDAHAFYTEGIVQLDLQIRGCRGLTVYAKKLYIFLKSQSPYNNNTVLGLFTNSIQLMANLRLTNSHCHINNKRWHVDQISDPPIAQTPLFTLSFTSKATKLPHPVRFLTYFLKFMQSPPNLPASQIISNQIIRLSPRVRFHLCDEGCTPRALI